MHPDLIQDDQHPIWRPSGKVFLKRAFLAGVIFAAIGNAAGLYFGFLSFDVIGVLIALSSIVVAAVFYMIAFDEWQNWNRHRHDEWRLTPLTLGFRNTDESAAFSDLPLAEIRVIRPSFWRGILIRMSDGRAFHLSYLPDSKDKMKQIKMAKAALGNSTT